MKPAALRFRRSVLIAALMILAPFAAAHADLGDCGQPLTSGAQLAATDCLYILRVAVGIEACTPDCICAPKGALPTAATDALVCLNRAVGIDVALTCPCPTTTSTIPPPDTTTTTTTTTSTSTTTIQPVTTTTLGVTTTLDVVTTTTTTTTSTTTTTTLAGFAEADDAALDRLDEVLSAATSMLESGQTYSDVAQMLAAEPDVGGVYSNGITLFFSVGGIPTAMHDGVAARLGGPGHEVIPPAGGESPRAAAGTRPPVASHTLASNPVPAIELEPVLPVGQRIPGEDGDGDGVRDLPKQALILAPYAFYFEPWDSAFDVQELLLMQRDYQEGAVITRSNNQDLRTATLSINDWIGWDDYDVIFFSSHGDADANAPFGPDPFVLLGIGGSSCRSIGTRLRSDRPVAADRSGLFCVATNLSADNDNPVWGYDLIATRAFWNRHHPNLQKKLIVGEACRTTFHPGLATALAGDDSIFLGWDEYVNSDHSQTSHIRLFTEAAERGFPALRAFLRSCIDGSCIEPLDEGSPGYDGTKPAELEAAWNRTDLRIREGLQLFDPPIAGPCFEAPDLPLQSTCPSCDGTAALFVQYAAVIEGLLPQDIVLRDDPLDFAIENLRLFADVDGEESGFAAVAFEAFLEDLGDGRYGFVPAVTLYANEICPGETFEYRPWVLLPAFDLNMPGNDARDRLYSWEEPWIVAPGQGLP